MGAGALGVFVAGWLLVILSGCGGRACSGVPEAVWRVGGLMVYAGAALAYVAALLAVIAAARRLIGSAVRRSRGGTHA